MSEFSDNLSCANIDQTLANYIATVERLGESIKDLRGIRLFEALKRDAVNAGPYPTVTLFEAANRIMTDLVILYGVRWLLKRARFPFDTYVVEYGNEDKRGYDIRAENGGVTLIGEAFKVAPSFFQAKKCAMLKKLRESTVDANYKVVMFNDEAVRPHYDPARKDTEFYVIVRLGTDDARVVP